MKITRRSFAATAGMAAAGSLLGLRQFGALNALAQGPQDYKALVCVFLFGGNDANNTLVPFDHSGYTNYAAVRGPLALAQNSLLQLSPAPNFALHPAMPELRSLFNNNHAAFVANVGTLIEPLTQAQYQSGAAAPSNLFSHPDQQLEWQNAGPSAATPSGWAGRIADMLTPTYNVSATIPMITSVSGDTLFCNGNETSPLSISPGNTGNPYCSEGAQCDSRQLAAQKLLTMNTGLSLVQADDVITTNAFTYAKVLGGALGSLPPLHTVFPQNNYLAEQLYQVAQMIEARAALGIKRQIFFAGVGNFDTHADQLDQQGYLLQQLSQALNAFYNATVELGVQNSVTAFTMSDFSRTFQPNSNNGSDHAWGSHHIVLGGAVKGGQIYGNFPTLALGGPNDSDVNGRWIPTTSNSQYAATLAEWFGVPAANLATVLPVIGNFSTVNLGFV